MEAPSQANRRAGDWEVLPFLHPTGASLTIQVLHSTLVFLFKKSEEIGKPLPRELHLRCDNCSRENKTRVVCAYLLMLVRWGLFDKVELHFGLKDQGHTHDEIDQVFSRVGVALKEQPAVTHTCLGHIIASSYKKNVSCFPVEIEHLYNLANMRDLLVGCTFPIRHITNPQAFRFSTDPTDGKIKTQVQHRSYENQWARIDARVTSSVQHLLIVVGSRLRMHEDGFSTLCVSGLPD
ncbi:unnamed protein product [Ascophyllum nodosum]